MTEGRQIDKHGLCPSEEVLPSVTSQSLLLQGDYFPYKGQQNPIMGLICVCFPLGQPRGSHMQNCEHSTTAAWGELKERILKAAERSEFLTLTPETDPVLSSRECPPHIAVEAGNPLCKQHSYLGLHTTLQNASSFPSCAEKPSREQRSHCQ